MKLIMFFLIMFFWLFPLVAMRTKPITQSAGSKYTDILAPETPPLSNNENIPSSPEIIPASEEEFSDSARYRQHKRFCKKNASSVLRSLNKKPKK